MVSRTGELILLRLPDLSLSDSLLFIIFYALVVHRIYNKYEIQPSNLPATILLLGGVPALPCYFLLGKLQSKILAVLFAYSLFYAALATSIILYRVLPLHPLAEYPGPISLKISKFVGMYYASGGKQYALFKDLHDKYGPIVRVGPNHLSVTEVEAVHQILGPDGMRKGPLWDAVVKPGTPPNIVALRDIGQHNERRKLWNHAFTTVSLKELQVTVQIRVLELVEELRKHIPPKSSGEKDTSLDLAQWLTNFTYDFMGDMVFGEGFGLMSCGDGRGMRALLENYAELAGHLEHIPWITGLLYKLAAVSAEQQNFEELAIQRYEKRKEEGSKRRDLFHYFTNEEGLEKMEVSRDQCLNEVFASIFAGGDTTSTVLGGIFFHLLANPAVLGRLRKEVDSEFPYGEGEPFDAVKLAGMPYLNAVINETLRLQPAVATSIQRTPIEGSCGKVIAGRWMSEGTILYVPPYVIHRDPRYFSPSPDLFIPERWLDTMDDEGRRFTTDTSAFIPFSAGPANCVGKSLALLEMRMVVATIVQRFEMKFATGYDPRKWEEDLQDFFVMKVGELPVILNARE
ncbi:hypothetical protein ACEPAG_5702 [Sanghuangporus baumii]